MVGFYLTLGIGGAEHHKAKILVLFLSKGVGWAYRFLPYPLITIDPVTTYYVGDLGPEV